MFRSLLRWAQFRKTTVADRGASEKTVGSRWNRPVRASSPNSGAVDIEAGSMVSGRAETPLSANEIDLLRQLFQVADRIALGAGHRILKDTALCNRSFVVANKLKQ